MGRRQRDGTESLHAHSSLSSFEIEVANFLLFELIEGLKLHRCKASHRAASWLSMRFPFSSFVGVPVAVGLQLICVIWWSELSPLSAERETARSTQSEFPVVVIAVERG